VLEEFSDGSGYDVAFALRDEMVARHHKSLSSVERFGEPGRLLDVGCGPGFLLEAARERGWEAVGVDPSPFSVARARREGFEAHEGMLEDLDLETASFDALALLQVVEHMTDPRPLLAACRALLKPRGVLLVATPNPASLLARVKRERFNYWIPPVHCTWYTPAALSRLLSANGFAPVREMTWSARTRALHDGVDVVASTRIGKRLPVRAHRALGGAIAATADVLGYGSIVEHIAIKWGER
jgi:SAM-dependent methyltransferase